MTLTCRSLRFLRRAEHLSELLIDADLPHLHVAPSHHRTNPRPLQLAPAITRLANEIQGSCDEGLSRAHGHSCERLFHILSAARPLPPASVL